MLLSFPLLLPVSFEFFHSSFVFLSESTPGICSETTVLQQRFKSLYRGYFYFEIIGHMIQESLCDRHRNFVWEGWRFFVGAPS